MEELQKSLSLKSQELEAKNALANQKLKQMVSEIKKNACFDSMQGKKVKSRSNLSGAHGQSLTRFL